VDVPPGSRLKTPAVVARCTLLQAGDLLVVEVESVEVEVVQLADGSGCNGGRSDGSKVGLCKTHFSELNTRTGIFTTKKCNNKIS